MYFLCHRRNILSEFHVSIIRGLAWKIMSQLVRTFVFKYMDYKRGKRSLTDNKVDKWFCLNVGNVSCKIMYGNISNKFNFVRFIGR